jgi:hypothetical protein
MHMREKSARLDPLITLGLIFVITVLLNYPWELLQGVLYAGADYTKGMWLHCFIASLGDGLMVLIIHMFGWATFRRSDWFIQRERGWWVPMIATGLVLGVVVEWVAVHLLARWSYTDQMPLVPGLGIGMIPVLQMLILPRATFASVAKFRPQSQSVRRAT